MVDTTITTTAAASYYIPGSTRAVCLLDLLRKEKMSRKQQRRLEAPSGS